MRYKNKKNRRKKRFVVIVVVLCIIIAGGAVTASLIYRHYSKPTGDLQKTSTGYDVNLAPPTEEEKKETEQSKRDIAEDQEKEELGTGSPSPQVPAPTPSEGKANKPPFIVFAGQEGQSIELNGYVPGIFEDNGTCTATFTKGTLRVTGQSKGFKDYNHTSCVPITIDRSKFLETGDWQVTLSYSSVSSNGISKSSTVVVK